MSYNIDQVNGESSQAQIDEARRQANAEIQTIEQSEAVVEQEQRAQTAKEDKYNRDYSVYEEKVAKEDRAESTVAAELATQGAPAAVQLASAAGQIITDRKQSDPAHLDDKKLEKMTNGTVKTASTFESLAEGMTGSKLPSMRIEESDVSRIAERVKMQEDFTKSGAKGMAVPPDAINVQQVKSLTMDLAQKAHFEMTLANAARAEQDLSAANRNMAPSLGGPNLSLASGPTPPKVPTDEETAMA